MTEHLTNEERRALLAGGRADPLEPEEAAELGILAERERGLASQDDAERSLCRKIGQPR